VTLLLYILALVCFFIAIILPPVQPPEARLRIIAAGLAFWLLPALLAAAHVHTS
jgi:hypothetical protein